MPPESVSTRLPTGDGVCRPAWMPGPFFELLSDPGRALVVVILAACLFRFGSFVALGPVTDMVGDVPSYVTPGVRLADGMGYTREDGMPALRRAPGFPLQIALSRWLTGDLRLAYLLNAAWGAGAVVAVFALGRQAFGGTLVGATAAIFYAAMPQPIQWQRLLLSDSLHTILILLWALAILKALENGSGRLFAVAGLMLAAVLYVRPASALLVPVVPALALLSRATRKNAGWLLLSGLIAVLVILPWSLRNYAVSGRVIPVAVGFGAAAYLGNLQDGANGGFSRDYPGAPVADDIIREFEAAMARSDWEGDAYAQSLVPGLLRERIANDFWDWLLSAKLANLSRFFLGRPFAVPLPWWTNYQSALVLTVMALTALSFPFLAQRFSPLGPQVFCWLLGSLLIMHIATTSVRRYSEPILPFLALGSAAALLGHGPAWWTRIALLRTPAGPERPRVVHRRPGPGTGG